MSELEELFATEKSAEKPMITHRSFLSLQVCVPKDWDDAKVKEWTNQEDLCGTTNGWCMRDAEPVRVQCEDRPDFVHILLQRFSN